jgi:hypothetical protein
VRVFLKASRIAFPGLRLTPLSIQYVRHGGGLSKCD